MKSRILDDFWLFNRKIAHRGYHDVKKGIAENSLSAYKLAVEKNYAIEMDIQMTKDGKLVCFHDDDLFRITGVKGLIWDKTLTELKSLKLQNTNDVILTFEEFLDIINGKVPLLIEIKNQREKGIEKKVLKALEKYKGDYVIQSFNPIIMLKIKKYAPNVIRGILGGNEESLSFPKRLLVKNLLLNRLIKPDFINYDLRNLPLSNNVTKGLPLISWTVRNEKDKFIAEKYSQNYVFEYLDL